MDTASTSDAVTFITYVQSLKRKIKQFEKQVEVSSRSRGVPAVCAPAPQPFGACPRALPPPCVEAPTCLWARRPAPRASAVRKAPQVVLHTPRFESHGVLSCKSLQSSC